MSAPWSCRRSIIVEQRERGACPFLSRVARVERCAPIDHWQRLPAPQTPKGPPNPALFVAVALSSLAAYYALVHHRAATAPASSRPRPNDHPLVWPVHAPDQDRDGTQLRREDR